MESPITLIADNKNELNRLIDEKLKAGYLIKGGMELNDEQRYVQVMVLANNIDAEFTPRAAIKLAIFLPLYIALLYFLI